MADEAVGRGGDPGPARAPSATLDGEWVRATDGDADRARWIDDDGAAPRRAAAGRAGGAGGAGVVEGAPPTERSRADA